MNYFAQTKGLINAVDMKEYSRQQSEAQLSEIFDDLYDDLVNDIWETAQTDGKTEVYFTTNQCLATLANHLILVLQY